MVRALGIAELDEHRGDSSGAITGFASVLADSKDPAQRQEAIDGAIGMEEKLLGTCELTRDAHTALQLVFNASNNGDSVGTEFFGLAAKVEVAFVDCGGPDGRLEDADAIQLLFASLVDYPQGSDAASLITNVVLDRYSKALEDSVSLEAMLEMQDVVTAGFEESGVPLEADLNTPLMKQLRTRWCSVNNRESKSPFYTSGVAVTRGVLSCWASLDNTGVLEATVPGEVWYVLDSEREYINGMSFRCTVGDDYYNVEGQWVDTLILSDATTGQRVSEKSFTSTPPVCCGYGQFSGHGLDWCYNATGSESTVSDSAVGSWLRNAVK